MSELALTGEHRADSSFPELNSDQLIQLLSIYSDRENFHIAQHQTRANFYIGLVVSGLSLACIAWSQYRSSIDHRILVLVPIMMIAVAELAIASLRRTFERVNDNIAARYTVEQMLGLQKPTPIKLAADQYYFPGEPIKPIDQTYAQHLRQSNVHKGNYTKFTSNMGQQLYLKVIFRLLQAFSSVLGGLFVLS
jgi:hypothetical protein